MTDDELPGDGARTERPRRGLRARHGGSGDRAHLGLPGRPGDRPCRRHAARLDRRRLRQERGHRRCARRHRERRAQARAHQQRPVQPEEDVEHYTMSCASNGSIELFIQPYSARSALCVLGSTPAADEARFLAERFRIRLTDTPGEAPVVLVATQGQGDEDALEAALRSPAQAGADDCKPAQGGEAARRDARCAASTNRSLRACRRRPARMPAPRRRAKSHWSRSSGCWRCCAVAMARLREAAVRRRRGRPRRRSPAATGRHRGKDRFVNPVCGMAVSIADAVHAERHEDVSYYFCCDGCRTTFRKDPAEVCGDPGSAAGHGNEGGRHERSKVFRGGAGGGYLVAHGGPQQAAAAGRRGSRAIRRCCPARCWRRGVQETVVVTGHQGREVGARGSWTCR